jgi:hypothetical protein
MHIYIHLFKDTMVNLLFFKGVNNPDFNNYPKLQPYSVGGGQLQPYSGGVRFPKTEIAKLVAEAAADAVKQRVSNNNGNNNNNNNNNNGGNNNGGSRRRSKNRNNGGRGKKAGNGGSGNNGGFGNSNSEGPNNSDQARGFQQVPGTSCILWSSNVASGLTINSRIVTEDYTPLYLSSGTIFLVTDKNIAEVTPFFSQLDNIIYPLVEGSISNKIQRYAGRYIKTEDFSTYVKALVKALQVYYCLDNVMTYTSNVTLGNVNVGMERLRSQISAGAQVEYNLLKEFLSTCPCPPKLLEYIRFMCQSFRTSTSPHAPIIRLNIFGMFDEDWVGGTPDKIYNLLRECRTDLVNANKMTSYLNQTFPEWTINMLPMSSGVACFDINFFTFWHNQICCYLSTDSNNKGNFVYTVMVKSLDEYTDLQIFQDPADVDGVMLVTNSYNIGRTGSNMLDSYWGVWHPLATLANKNSSAADSRESFNVKCLNSTGAISALTNEVVKGSSGIHWLVEYTGAPGSRLAASKQFGTHGFIKLQNSSVRMTTEAFNNSMREWFL